ncbi:MAG TPA: hypothetical protein VEF04_01315 [Blastocatellia bacterium]|nr:hypothetical protein [Blastocatellia bacterium]
MIDLLITAVLITTLLFINYRLNRSEREQCGNCKTQLIQGANGGYFCLRCRVWQRNAA